MRKFSLQTVLGMMVIVFVAVLPLETSANVCFNAAIGALNGTFDIDIAASNDQFHSLVGEFVLPTGRTPIVGTARIRPDGVAEIGGVLPANPGEGLVTPSPSMEHSTHRPSIRGRQYSKA